MQNQNTDISNKPARADVEPEHPTVEPERQAEVLSNPSEAGRPVSGAQTAPPPTPVTYPTYRVRLKVTKRFQFRFMSPTLACAISDALAHAMVYPETPGIEVEIYAERLT